MYQSRYNDVKNSGFFSPKENDLSTSANQGIKMLKTTDSNGTQNKTKTNKKQLGQSNIFFYKLHFVLVGYSKSIISICSIRLRSNLNINKAKLLCIKICSNSFESRTKKPSQFKKRKRLILLGLIFRYMYASIHSTMLGVRVSEWLLYNVNSVIVQLYHGKNKLIF